MARNGMAGTTEGRGCRTRPKRRFLAAEKALTRAAVEVVQAVVHAANEALMRASVEIEPAATEILELQIVQSVVHASIEDDTIDMLSFMESRSWIAMRRFRRVQELSLPQPQPEPVEPQMQELSVPQPPPVEPQTQAIMGMILKVRQASTSLDLGGGNLGDAGAVELAKALKENHALTSLNLQNNGIGDAGAKELAKALRQNLALTSLNLRNNVIGDVGATELAKALRENPATTSLDLQFNDFGDAGARELATAFDMRYLPEFIRGKRVLCETEGVGWYRVDNSELQNSARGMGYRRSKDVSDIVSHLPGVPWNCFVQGELHNGWLRVSVQASAALGVPPAPPDLPSGLFPHDPPPPPPPPPPPSTPPPAATPASEEREVPGAAQIGTATTGVIAKARNYNKNPQTHCVLAEIDKKPKVKEAISRRKKQIAKQGRFADLGQYLRSPDLKVVSGEVISLQTEAYISNSELATIFDSMMEDGRPFRWYGGRSAWDYKVEGADQFWLSSPYDILNPLVNVLIALAMKSLVNGEKLSILQLIVNLFKDGDNYVKSHHHRCRQICVSLGATRDLKVEGHGTITMQSGDALPLMGETHSVPPSQFRGGPRISVCLFFCTKAEYAAESVSVHSAGDSFWWHHPEDSARNGQRTYNTQRGSRSSH